MGDVGGDVVGDLLTALASKRSTQGNDDALWWFEGEV